MTDWLVRTADGRQFSVTTSRASADHWANRINGTVEPYTPNPTTYWTSGETHADH